MKVAVRTLAELEPSFVLAPERHVLVAQMGAGTPLGDLVRERRERIDPAADPAPLVLDTSHARDGVIDVAAALRLEGGYAKSTKKRACVGDVIVSRLRPYLRQIAFVHPSAMELCGERELALSTEFIVLAPRSAKEDLAFLVRYLLSNRVQAILASAQEGGHHPRVPLSSLLSMRVPSSEVRTRERTSREVRAALDDVYRSTARLTALLTSSETSQSTRH